MLRRYRHRKGKSRRAALRAALTAVAIMVVPVVATSAAPGGPPEIVTFQDQFDDVNPCSGEAHTLFSTVTMRIHQFDNEAADRHHANIQFFIQISTSDGFSGTIVGPDIQNGAGLFGSEGGTGMFASMGNGVLSNPETKQQIRVHGSFHVTLVNMATIVDNSTFVLECVGRPAG